MRTQQRHLLSITARCTVQNTKPAASEAHENHCEAHCGNLRVLTLSVTSIAAQPLCIAERPSICLATQSSLQP